MGSVTHLRRARPGSRRGSARWFQIVLVALPLAAFTAVLLLPTGGGAREAEGATTLTTAGTSTDVAAPTPNPARDRERARFELCSGPVRVTCVVDGDTIWYKGTKIRIADLDTPEVSRPACANEAAMGRKATARLQALLNAGPFSLEPNPDGRTEDRYGRSLLLVTRGGASLGAVLVDEGLAEQWGGAKRAWC